MVSSPNMQIFISRLMMTRSTDLHVGLHRHQELPALHCGGRECWIKNKDIADAFDKWDVIF